MFDKVTFSKNVLLFHTKADASQAGSITTLRQAGVAFTPQTVSLGKYGPFTLPAEVSTSDEFKRLLTLNDNSLRVVGLSKSPRKRPDWPMVTYAYRLYASHDGVETSKDVPLLLAPMVEAKRNLWNALCGRCIAAMEKGQTITAEVLDALALDVNTTLTAFNDSLGRSKHKIPFPKDDVKEIPAKRVGAYARFVSRLGHLAEEEKPVPEGLRERVSAVLVRYPYDWAHFRDFEKSILSVSSQLMETMSIPAVIGSPVVQAYRATFKRRRSMKMKGFDGIPHPKDVRNFGWFHEFSFGSGGFPVTRLKNKGSSSVRFGEAVSPEQSGHPLMRGRKATLRSLCPVTFTIGEQDVTFALMMHRPLPDNGLLKQWRLLFHDGQYWVNFMMEIPPYVERLADVVEGVAGLDLNWRVLPNGALLLGMVADGTDDTMIEFDMERSAKATDQGGMIETSSQGGFRVISLGVGPSRWGRNNLRQSVNYSVPDTFAGASIIRSLRDKAKDELKIQIDRMLGDDSPSYLSLCGARGLKQLAKELDASHPEVSEVIRLWAVKDEDVYRVTLKISALLSGRMKRGYEQLAHHLCRKLAARGITRIAIEKNFLKAIAEAEKKYQPVALQKSAQYRQSVGASNFILVLDNIGAKYGITLVRRDAAYTTTRCRFCGGKCEFGAKRTAQCPGCSLVIDQDQNAAHNLRDAEMEEISNPAPQEVKEDNTNLFSWTLTIGRVSPDGELRQKRDLLLTGKATERLPALTV
jgi:hypothetical protein